MKKPRWNKMFRWVKVGEVPPYVPVLYGYIIGPLYIMQAISSHDPIMLIAFLLSTPLNMLFGAEVIRETFFYDVD